MHFGSVPDFAPQRGSPVNSPPHHAFPHHPSPDGAARDELAEFFLQLRRHIGRPLPEIAHRLGAHTSVIAHLELGRYAVLPPWPETVRIVSLYLSFAGIDPHPVLTRLARAVELAHSGPQAPRSQRRRGDGEDEGAGGWVDGVKTALAGSMRAARLAVDRVRDARHPVKLVAALAIGLAFSAAVAPSGILQASVSHLPAPLGGLFRSLGDEFAAANAPVREGHRWIEVDDPRSRRGDKLPVSGR